MSQLQHILGSVRVPKFLRTKNNYNVYAPIAQILFITTNRERITLQ